MFWLVFWLIVVAHLSIMVMLMPRFIHESYLVERNKYSYRSEKAALSEAGFSGFFKSMAWPIFLTVGWCAGKVQKKIQAEKEVEQAEKRLAEYKRQQIADVATAKRILAQDKANKENEWEREFAKLSGKAEVKVEPKKRKGDFEIIEIRNGMGMLEALYDTEGHRLDTRYL